MCSSAKFAGLQITCCSFFYWYLANNHSPAGSSSPSISSFSAWVGNLLASLVWSWTVYTRFDYWVFIHVLEDAYRRQCAQVFWRCGSWHEFRISRKMFCVLAISIVCLHFWLLHKLKVVHMEFSKIRASRSRNCPLILSMCLGVEHTSQAYLRFQHKCQASLYYFLRYLFWEKWDEFKEHILPYRFTQ